MYKIKDSDTIFVAGHKGMVGSAIVRQLKQENYKNIITKTSAELDLTNQLAVKDFFSKTKIDIVFLAAAKVGGIHANNEYPADFIYNNLMIENNVIHQAWASGVQRLLFLGSSCIYPRMATQPMSECSLLSGFLEPTNEPYAIAKIAGIKLCESYNRQYKTDYRSVMPTNLYGENDNFHPLNSHVIPAMMRRFHNAKQNNREFVLVWGSGTPMREFLHVDDMASACLHVLQLEKSIFKENTQPNLSHINVGTGLDCTIKELAETMAKVIGFKGKIEFDTSKPDGTPRKLMNVSRLNNLGWNHKIGLEKGLESTYQWYLKNADNVRT